MTYYSLQMKNIGSLLLIDFEKAFDSVSWSFINKVLKFFNFTPSIIKWITVLNKNAFILCAEILSIRLRNNKNIKGINIDKVELNFSQYADDTTAFLDGPKSLLKRHYRSLTLLQTYKD